MFFDEQYANFYDTEDCQGSPTSRVDYSDRIDIGCFNGSSGSLYSMTFIPGQSTSTDVLSTFAALYTAAIIGIAIGGFAVIVLIGVAVYYCACRRAVPGANKTVEIPMTSV